MGGSKRPAANFVAKRRELDVKLEPDRVAAGLAVTLGALAVFGVYELLEWLRDAESERQEQRIEYVCTKSATQYGQAGYYDGVRCTEER